MKEALSLEVLGKIESFSGVPQVEMIQQGMAMQQTKTAYTTAVSVQKPRSIAKVTKNVLEEAKLAGASFYYRWPVKNKKTGRTSIVQGASIDLTMAIARNYGNCVIDIDVEETQTHYLFKGVFIDLESGFTVPRLFRQRKSQGIGGGYEKERVEDIVFQIGQSKAQRNAIDKAAPGWLIEQAIDTARQAEIDKVKPENIFVARGKVLDFFATYGITQERIEAKLETPADNWTSEQIADLRASATGLKEGRVGPEELFPALDSENCITPNAPAPKEKEGAQANTATVVPPEKVAKETPKSEPPVKEKEEDPWKDFVDSMSPDQVAKQEAFIKRTADDNNLTVEDVRIDALGHQDAFLAVLDSWTPPENEGAEEVTLIDEIKAMRPKTSEKNKSIFRALIVDNTEKIQEMIEKDQDYVRLKWSNTFPEETFDSVMSPFVEEERPPDPPAKPLEEKQSSMFGGSSEKSDGQHAPPWKRRADWLSEMKMLHDKNETVYFNVIGAEGYEAANDVPENPETEEMILTLVKSEIPG